MPKFALCYTEETLAVRYPINQNKANTDDLSAFVSKKKHLLIKVSGGAFLSQSRGRYLGNPRR